LDGIELRVFIFWFFLLMLLSFFGRLMLLCFSLAFAMLFGRIVLLVLLLVFRATILFELLLVS